MDNRISNTAEAEGSHCRPLALVTLVGASNLSDLEFTHDPKAKGDDESTNR